MQDYRAFAEWGTHVPRYLGIRVTAWQIAPATFPAPRTARRKKFSASRQACPIRAGPVAGKHRQIDIGASGRVQIGERSCYFYANKV